MSAQPNPTPTPISKSWEDEWFEKEGVKDDAEKEAIRGRARVMRYANAKQKHDEEESDPKNPKNKQKPWYKE
jgi:hypothetical protein